MDKRTSEGIESCRPSSDDVRGEPLCDVARQVDSDAMASEYYRRVQAWDAAISRTLDDTPVPADLAERLVERLRAAAPVVDEPLIELPQEAPTALVIGRRWSRRSLGASMAAAAALLVVALGAWSLQSRPTDSIDAMADGWVRQLSTQWREMAEAPSGFKLPPSITAVPQGWQRLDASAVRGIVYRLRANASSATLFVLKLSRGASGLPSTPPPAPHSTGGGQAIGYWQAHGFVYVLVVPDERGYRTFVRLVSEPVA